MRWLPGFRSGVWWKRIVASVYYGFCLVAIVGVMTSDQPVPLKSANAGFYLLLLALGIGVPNWLRHRSRRQPRQITCWACGGSGISHAHMGWPGQGHQPPCYNCDGTGVVWKR
jgi:hypothetical protein